MPTNVAIETKKEALVSVDSQTIRKMMPHGHPFLMIDYIQAYHHEKKRLVAIKNVSQNEPFLQGHFPGHPIFPGVLIIEALAQSSGCLWGVHQLMADGCTADELSDNAHKIKMLGTILAESKIKHTQPVYPGDQISLETQMTLERDAICVFKVVATIRGGIEVSKGQLTLAQMEMDEPL